VYSHIIHSIVLNIVISFRRIMGNMKTSYYLAICLTVSFLLGGLNISQPVFADSFGIDSSVIQSADIQNPISNKVVIQADGGADNMSEIGSGGGNVWGVYAGGQSSDASLQAMAFYPGVTTINVGDTVAWALDGLLPHTVSFLSGAQPPVPGSPESLTPVPCDTYNGTGICSSGLLTLGQVFVLTFTEPGVYSYICEIHPGMQGVVVVRPAGTPYPQSQLDNHLSQKLQEDLLALRDAVNRHHINTIPGANGTLTFDVAAGVSTDEFVNVTLSATQGEPASGFATLNVTAPGALQVIVNVSGLAPNSVHPEHIHLGTCDAGGPILYPLNNLTAGPDGTASSVTGINGPPTLLIASDSWFIKVHAGPTMAGNGSNPISCGDVVYGAGSLMRVIPGFLVVRSGDTVKRTNYSPQEIHTTTFLSDGMMIPDFPSPQALQQSGNNTNYNGTGYYNSGAVLPGQSYSLTFTNPGFYTYFCLVHDEMNMIGYIEVLPATSNTTVTPLVRSAAQIGVTSSVGVEGTQQGVETTSTDIRTVISSIGNSRHRINNADNHIPQIQTIEETSSFTTAIDSLTDS
jgi:plastocyanin